MPVKTIDRHRPSLTTDEIRHLDKLVKAAYVEGLTAQPYHPDSCPQGRKRHEEDLELSLMQKLSVLIAKIDSGAKVPAYSTAKKESLEESLGMVETLDTETKEEYWQRCYHKYKDDPLSCTVEELKAATEHMYLNDLMSDEQVAQYEKEMGL